MAQIDRYTCQETFQRLDDYLDRELTLQEMQLVREHLDVCAVCASEYAFEASVLKQLRDKLQRITAPPDLLARVSRALERARDDTSAP
jgi:anti-sigma factor (TIGR02949 family)